MDQSPFPLRARSLPKRVPLDEPGPALKLLIALEIVQILDGWSERNAAYLIETAPQRVSDLRAGRLKRFSLEKLLQLLSRLDRRVDLQITVIPNRLELDFPPDLERVKVLSCSDAAQVPVLLAEIRHRARRTRHFLDE